MTLTDQKQSLKANVEILADFTSTYPVDVKAAAEAIGVRVLADDLPEGVSGKIQKDTRGSYYIVVNKRDSEVRQRFTIAHELGHFMYHRDLIGDGVADSPAYRAPDETIYETTPLERFHETQANRFAANLLMPQWLLKELRQQGHSSDQALAQALNVSLPAMRVRLGKDPYPSGLDEFDAVEEEDGDGGLAPLTDGPRFR